MAGDVPWLIVGVRGLLVLPSHPGACKHLGDFSDLGFTSLLQAVTAQTVLVTTLRFLLLFPLA